MSFMPHIKLLFLLRMHKYWRCTFTGGL